MSVIISPSLVLGPDGIQPLTHARIGIQTFAIADNLVPVDSTPGAAGFPLSALSNALTYESWKSSLVSPALSVVVFDRTLSPETPDWDYFGIAAHNLGSIQCVVRLFSGPTVAGLVLIEEFIPGDDAPIMALVSARSDRFGGIQLAPVVGTTPIMSVVYMGKALAVERPIYGGHSPIDLSRVTVTRPTVSETGQFIGRTKIRKGKKSSFDWTHLGAQWYRDNFDPFVELARDRPFFIAWRPSLFPDEVAYAWTTGDIVPSNMGLGDLMQVSVPVEALDVAAA